MTIVNTAGIVCLCQHLDASAESDQVAWEATLARMLLVEDRGLLKDACFRCDTSRREGWVCCVRIGCAVSRLTSSCVIGCRSDKFVLARGVDQLIFMLTGSGEHDELACELALSFVLRRGHCLTHVARVAPSARGHGPGRRNGSSGV